MKSLISILVLISSVSFASPRLAMQAAKDAHAKHPQKVFSASTLPKPNALSGAKAAHARRKK